MKAQPPADNVELGGTTFAAAAAASCMPDQLVDVASDMSG